MSISQIYAAFDGDSHQVFRRAMRESCGGVVRVHDLILALVELNLPPRHPELATPSNMVRDLAPRMQAKHGEDANQVAMSNEPALREVLQSAWRIAAAQARRDTPSITLACLAASVLIYRGRHGNSIEDLFQQLGLHIPAGTARPAVRVNRSVSPTGEPSSLVQSAVAEVDTDRLIEEALERWLKLQSIKNDDERTHAVSELTQLVATIEQAR